MAVTSIWSRKSRMDHLVDYAVNPKKTGSNIFTAKELEGIRNLGDVSNGKEDLLYVSYLNCMEGSAAEEMEYVRKRFDKPGGILGYHAYQSFSPGEVTPETAHEIGVRLAEEMWGDRFQVVVATHLDHDHIHNHFVINSVSFADGYKYNENKAEYRRMRETSDRLCIEHGLSVIGDEQRANGKKKPYGEWKADKEDRTTWRGLIREDIDRCISCSTSFDMFMDNLASLGYFIKGYKDGLRYISIRPEGKERYVRMTQKSLGYGYSEEQICERIELGHVSKKRPETVRIRRNPYTESFTLIGIYKWFRFELDAAQKDINENFMNGSLPFPIREELVRLEQFQREYTLIIDNNVETSVELDGLAGKKKEDLAYLETKLKEALAKGPSSRKEEAYLRNEIRKVKYDLKLCQNIYRHSVELEEKIREMNDFPKEKRSAHDQGRNKVKRRKHIW